MGLSPYGKLMRRDQPSLPDLCPPLMSGDLMRQPGEAGAFTINWETLETLPHANEWAEADAKKTEYYGLLADRVQRDLEDVCLKWIRDLKEKTGAKNLCLVGGVALNSVLNGRVISELGFERVFVPPYPGDEGIAVGCAVYGLHHLRDGQR
jgi:predicted NodU family carbamoyl transferase